MALLDRYAAALKVRQQELATSALVNPGDTGSFYYGRACGIHAGLQEAMNILDDTMRDQVARDGQL